MKPRDSSPCSQPAILSQTSLVQFMTVFSKPYHQPDQSSPIHHRVINLLPLDREVQSSSSPCSQLPLLSQSSPIHNCVINPISLATPVQSNSSPRSQPPIHSQTSPVQFITVFSTRYNQPDQYSPIHHRVFIPLSLAKPVQSNSKPRSETVILSQTSPIQFITVFSSSYPQPNQSSPIHHRVLILLSLAKPVQSNSSPCSHPPILSQTSPIQLITVFSNPNPQPDMSSSTHHHVFNPLTLATPVQSNS